MPEELFLRILEAEILDLSTRPDILRLDRLERAATEIAAALREKRPFVTTLGGARIAVTSDGNLEVTTASPRRSA
jgi:hypothetical protein